ncbi:hypothetical protein [Streptomyces sp. NPDC002088]|uniref:hypothetical protein n=1 Tax=Streptomyces sp. NPDC002088 TaxID=3154665 RepID=UPI00332DA112
MSAPCARPECGGDTHTDGWGNPTRCPHDTPERPKPRASVIELIAPDYQPTDDGAGSIIVPREVRINGVPVYTPKDAPVQIGDIQLGDELVTVTLTLIARRVVIAADGDLGEQP